MSTETNTQISPEQKMSNLEAATIHADELLRDAPAIEHEDGKISQTAQILDREPRDEKRLTTRFPSRISKTSTSEGDEFTLTARLTKDTESFMTWARNGDNVRTGLIANGHVSYTQKESKDGETSRIAAGILSRSAVFDPEKHTIIATGKGEKIFDRPQGPLLRAIGRIANLGRRPHVDAKTRQPAGK